MVPSLMMLLSALPRMPIRTMGITSSSSTALLSRAVRVRLLRAMIHALRIGFTLVAERAAGQVEEDGL